LRFYQENHLNNGGDAKDPLVIGFTSLGLIDNTVKAMRLEMTPLLSPPQSQTAVGAGAPAVLPGAAVLVPVIPCVSPGMSVLTNCYIVLQLIAYMC
jgi:hypothetical protein